MLDRRLKELELSVFYKDFEIICVDNNSIDNTESVVRLHNLKYYKQMLAGRCHALQMGIDIATGEYLLLLDDDDPVNSIELDKCLKDIARRLTSEGVARNYFFSCSFKDGWLPEFVHNEIYDWYDVMFRKSIRDMKQICQTSILKRCQPILSENELRMPTSWYWLSMSAKGALFTYLDYRLVSKHYVESGMSHNVQRLISQSPNNHVRYYKMINEIHLNKLTLRSFYLLVRNHIKLIYLRWQKKYC